MRSAADPPAAGRHWAWLLGIVLLAGFALVGPALLVARNLPAADGLSAFAFRPRNTS